MYKIKVKNSGTVLLQNFKDYPDGDLFIAEAEKNIPFPIRRVYFINNLKNKSAIRGKHAHKTLRQVIICLNGSFELHLDDGKTKQTVKMKDSGVGIILGKYLWHDMRKFSKDCVLLVLASGHFMANDYIRNYDEFRRYIKNSK